MLFAPKKMFKTLAVLFVLGTAFLLLDTVANGNLGSKITGIYSNVTGHMAASNVTGTTSNDPMKDILEVSRAFGTLYGVDGCSLAKSMGAVFGVECNFRQNCGGGDRYIGSFQQGVPYVQGAVRKLGTDLTNMAPLAREGKINAGVYTHMLAAAQQGGALGANRGRLHHMYATMLALTEHVRMEKALQARTSNQMERAGAHVVFQFSPGNVGAAVNSGRDRNSPWGGQNGVPAGHTVFQAIRLAGSSQYKGASRVRKGVEGMNCSTTAGYTGPSGFGNVPPASQNSLLSQSPQSPLSQFFNQNQPAAQSQSRTYSEGYLDPNRNPDLRPENDSSQRATNSSISNSTSPESTSAAKNSILSGNTPTATSPTTPTFDDNGNPIENPTATTPITPKTITNTTPTLICLPSPIAPGEKTIIMWACRDGAYKTTADNLDTNEALIGAVTVSPSEDTTYTVTCVNNLKDASDTAASCAIHVANPALAIIATPRQTTRGGTVSLSWKTNDTNSCVVTSSEHSNFSRSATEGDVVSPSLTTNTTFTLKCETVTGAIQERSVGVGVTN